MSLSRRHVLSLGAAFGAGAALPTWAQGKPLFDTLNMFVPAAPGGGCGGLKPCRGRAAACEGAADRAILPGLRFVLSGPAAPAAQPASRRGRWPRGDGRPVR